MHMREDILAKRIYRKDASGIPTENWEGVCRRVVDAVGQTAAEKEEFFDMLHQGHFLPNSPALVNAGREKFSLSACFVLPIEDSIDSIFDGVKNMVKVHKSGGGTGFSFSRLRPKNSIVGSTNGVASGPISFMKIFDAATEEIKQGGVRRGANMGLLRVDHPDILEFISCKKQEDQLNNFNLSVGLTAAFMKAVEKDEEYALVFGGEEAGRLRAREVFDQIVKLAWENGEPGIVFLDRMNADNPTPAIGEFETTNPSNDKHQDLPTSQERAAARKRSIEKAQAVSSVRRAKKGQSP